MSLSSLQHGSDWDKLGRALYDILFYGYEIHIDWNEETKLYDVSIDKEVKRSSATIEEAAEDAMLLVGLAKKKMYFPETELKL